MLPGIICCRYTPVAGAAWLLYRAIPHIRGVLIQAMERAMSDVRRTSFGSVHPQDTEIPRRMDDLTYCPTPGEIFGQISRVIAACLVLGLLARVLVAFTGVH
jgi:hypothetical protein